MTKSGYNVTIVGDRALVMRLDAMGDVVQRALYTRITYLALIMEAQIKAKLAGPVLKIVTGALHASITHEVVRMATAVWGRLFSSGDVKYAAIHEFGGIIHHPGGTPYFVTEEGAVFVTKAVGLERGLPVTAPHDIPMPERSYMRSTLRENEVLIRDKLNSAVMAAVHGQVHGYGGLPL